MRHFSPHDRVCRRYLNVWQVFNFVVRIKSPNIEHFQATTGEITCTDPKYFGNVTLPLVKTFENRKIQKMKRPGTQTFHNFQNFIFSDMKIIIFKDAPICFLYFSKYFGDKCGVRGSRFGHIFGRSENHPKSIAIDQESLISSLRIV